MRARRGEPAEASEVVDSQPLTPGKPWRIFCAIELPSSVRERLMKHVARLKEAVPQGRASWSRENNIHLTLKFLGDTEQSRILDLNKAAARAVKDIEPFKILIEQTGAFPKLVAPRVLWVGITDKSGQLARLKQNLEDECAKVGFLREERSFHPHLTIARLRMPREGRDLAFIHDNMHFHPAEVVVSELCVIRSELSSGGSKYSVLSRFALKSSP